ncbi:MAG: DUF3616 domain-containing protein [Myxococcales bacterium]|nr:DUF3616 domain-containing protein [Myxococcales bacterium]
MGGLLLALGCSHGVAGGGGPAVDPLRSLAVSCEASALVHRGTEWIVGDNEAEDRVFVYDDAMQLLREEPLASPIEDIEALALAGNDLVVVGSHSLSKKGKPRPARHRIVGLGAPALALQFPGVDDANIEGAAYSNGTFLVGLRAPLFAGRARLMEVAGGAQAGMILRTTDVDLAGAGVRALAPWKGGLLIVGGPATDQDVPHSLWFLPALGAVPMLLPVVLPPSTEGIWMEDTRLRFVVDGSGEPGACKEPSRWGELDVPALAPAP